MNICVVGGAGYVGTELCASLCKNHDVTVLDCFWFGDHLPNGINKIKGDIRNRQDLRRAFNGQDAVIHLACVSNDPCFEMNPGLGKEINYDCFKDFCSELSHANVRRFIYASSSSVYGISDLDQVTEDTPKNPLTDYSKYKLACETWLKSYGMSGVWTILRPATVAGYGKRLRLDLVLNILSIQGIVSKNIKIFGGDQKRPNINIKDMVRAYEWVLGADERLIDQKTYNVGFENKTVYQLANTVKLALNDNSINIETILSTDNRSYHINSDKILGDGFVPKYNLKDAILDIQEAYDCGLIPHPFSATNYYNIRCMQELGLK